MRFLKFTAAHTGKPCYIDASRVYSIVPTNVWINDKDGDVVCTHILLGNEGGESVGVLVTEDAASVAEQIEEFFS